MYQQCCIKLKAFEIMYDKVQVGWSSFHAKVEVCNAMLTFLSGHFTQAEIQRLTTENDQLRKVSLQVLVQH